MATRERGASSAQQPSPRPPPYHRAPSSGADESPAALYKLEPIHQPRASTVILGGPQRPPRSAGIAAAGIAAHPQRGRRPSQDEIRALLQRTTAALDRIVQIRESMEPFVDFTQFDKPPVGPGRRRPSARLSSSGSDRPSEHDPSASASSSARTTPASSYGSTASSSSISSDDPLAGDADPPSSARSNSSLPTLLHQSSSLGDSDAPVSRSTTSTTRTLSKHDEEAPDEEDEDEDSSRDSSLSSPDEDVPPLKEARLERLKHVDVSFVEGLPREFYLALARFLYSVVEIKTRHSRFNFYKDAFTGADAVREMVLNGFCEDQQAALRLGNVLVRLQLVEHVSRTDDQLHNSKDNFYRFTKLVEAQVGDGDASLEFARDTAARSRRTSSVAAMSTYRESVLASRESAAVGDLVEYDFSEASDEVHALVTDEALLVLARVLLKVFERKNKLLFYKGFVGCFLGAEAVNVLRELRLATSLIDAVLVGQALLDEKLIEPIASSAAGSFQDKYVFYRLTTAAAAAATSLSSDPASVRSSGRSSASPSASLSSQSATTP